MRERVRPVRAAAFFSAPAERGTQTAAGMFAPDGRQPFSLHRLSGVRELRKRVRP